MVSRKQVANSCVVSGYQLVGRIEETRPAQMMDYWNKITVRIEIPEFAWSVLNRELCPVNIINIVIMIFRLEPLGSSWFHYICKCGTGTIEPTCLTRIVFLQSVKIIMALHSNCKYHQASWQFTAPAWIAEWTCVIALQTRCLLINVDMQIIYEPLLLLFVFVPSLQIDFSID